MVTLMTSRKREQGALMIELLAAMSLLLAVAIPLAWSFAGERRLARSLYQRAIAVQLVDGEMETLLSGEWRRFGEGRHPYQLSGEALKNLPGSECWLTIEQKQMRLVWEPGGKHHGGTVKREASLP